MGADFLPYYFFKFTGFPEIFRQCLPSISEIFGPLLDLISHRLLRGEDPTTGEDLFLGEDSSLREVSSRAVRAPGNRLPLKRKLRGIRASGISYD